MHMRLKILSILAAATIITACASDLPTPAAPPPQMCPPRSSDPASLAEAGDRVFFSFNSMTLSQDARAVLCRQIAAIARFPQARILIEGHADERGTREYNLALSERRASAVRNFLVQNGVQAERITMRSFGRERPVDSSNTQAAWTQNRRVVTALLEPGERSDSPRSF